MKKNSSPLFLLVGAVALIGALPLHAETGKEYDIKKIEPALFESPQITAGSYRKQAQQGRTAQWLEVDVTFDRKKSTDDQKFSGDLTFNYYILLSNKGVTKEGKQTLLKGSVVHTEVPEGRGLHACAFVSPQTLAVYFDGKPPTSIMQAVVDVGVEIIGKEGLVAIATSKGTVSADKGWWSNPKDMDVVEGKVLNKDNTPFSALAWDYYQPVKPKSGN
jgi:hypothetical protein